MKSQFLLWITRPFIIRSEFEQICLSTDIKLVYLPPYSPDFHPIEEFFAELKAFIKRNWKFFEDDPSQGFREVLERSVDTVGAREKSTQGHFRHAGLTIEEVRPGRPINAWCCTRST